MNNFTLFPQQSYKAKIAGLALTGAALLLMILESISPFTIIKRLSTAQHSQLCFLLILFGLFIIAFSKERIDDDRVKTIRGKVFQFGFGILVSLLIALSFVGTVNTHVIISLSNDLPLIILISLSVYLLLFNIGLYMDPLWIRSNETVGTNIKRNKIFFLVYICVLLMVVGYLIFIR
ncbi:hypothetical protein [Mucilaginibacter pedocola]|uniref:Uncharacterized protein n=1 Tax=Mucilaginibacter pedocola TaxID=1792845 RepID=A0A1S9PFW7_9SPHI|nr:hypothetical protein [Mucilaginibacter pedocola]OOQ59852.1 hypothetical protein BC343_06825 [Mucilaginibacter pedocola]